MTQVRSEAEGVINIDCYHRRRRSTAHSWLASRSIEMQETPREVNGPIRRPANLRRESGHVAPVVAHRENRAPVLAGGLLTIAWRRRSATLPAGCCLVAAPAVSPALLLWLLPASEPEAVAAIGDGVEAFGSRDRQADR